MSEVAGIQYRLTSGLSPGFGYTGIVVAMLGRPDDARRPRLGVPALGDLAVGASSAERALDIPSQMGAVVQGTLLLSWSALLALRRRWRVRRERAASGRGRVDRGR